MFTQYLKQGWALLRQHKFYTAIYVLGTVLAITMAMVIAIVYHIRSANIAPENHRDRMLIVGLSSAVNEESQHTHNWALSYQTLKECYYTLQTPQVVAAGANTNSLTYIVGDFYVRISTGETGQKSFINCTDAAFFQVFSYSFIQGRPYSEAEFQSGMRQAVLSEKLAYKLFKSRDVLNKTILVNDMDYTVIGVVKDVPSVLSYAYAELWIPFTSVPAVRDSKDGGDIVGPFTAFVLADKKADFPLIKEEVEQNRKKYNTSLGDWEYRISDDFMLSPFRLEIKKIDYRADFQDIILKFGLLAFIFLLVPALNLSGIISSKVQERISELGIRKAFGARRASLMQQVFTENLLLTLLGGLVGLFLSMSIVYFMRALLLSGYSGVEISLSFFMLFNIPVFLYSLGICVILNVLSSFVPVWNAARRPIVQAINDK